MDNITGVIDMDGFTINKIFYCKELACIRKGQTYATSTLLRYLKKNENRYRKKNTDNTDISIFFRDRIFLNFMQKLLNFMQKFLFSNDAKQPQYNSFDSSGA